MLDHLFDLESGDDNSGRLQCKEVFWWEGIQLVTPRPPLGLLGKLYTSNTKFNGLSSFLIKNLFKYLESILLTIIKIYFYYFKRLKSRSRQV